MGSNWFSEPEMFRKCFQCKLTFFVLILLLILAPFFIMVFYVETILVWPILLGISHLLVILLLYFSYANGLVVLQNQVMNQN